MSVKVSKTFNLILCPSHVTEKWVRELEETVPNAFAAVVHTPAELDHLYQMFERGNKFCFAVLSKEKAPGWLHEGPGGHLPTVESRGASH